MKYLVEKSKLGTTGAALLAQVAEIQSMTEPPPIPLVQPPMHDTPSPTKMFSTRGLRRMGVLARQRKAKRRAQKAARRKNRAG